VRSGSGSLPVRERERVLELPVRRCPECTEEIGRVLAVGGGKSYRKKGSVGRVTAFDVGTGKVLWSFDDPTGDTKMGIMSASELAFIGDVDGDGKDDLAVGNPGRVGEDAHAHGSIWVVSGADGHVLWERSGGRHDCFGGSIAAPGDLDGDGVPDVVVGSPWATGMVHHALGAVTALSGKDGKVLWRLDGERW
jgi:outer membrane protein assembly factor BamB